MLIGLSLGKCVHTVRQDLAGNSEICSQEGNGVVGLAGAAGQARKTWVLTWVQHRLGGLPVVSY